MRPKRQLVQFNSKGDEMRILLSLIALVTCASSAATQQVIQKRIVPGSGCPRCVRTVIKKRPAMVAQTPKPLPHQFFVGEARVDVTKDNTVIRLAMAQHGSVLIELPANDGPRYIIPGDPEMATVDQKALERNKRAIVVRPGTQFLPPPPLRNVKAQTPSATVTAQMRSGLVVTFLFYPVEDLAQNVHRCVLTYNRDEVVARRRAAGLPVNLDSTSERGEMTVQSVAPTSISVEATSEETKKKPTGAEPSLPPILQAPNKQEIRLPTIKEPPGIVATASLAEALRQPASFKEWTKPVRGLALSTQKSRTTPEGLEVVVLAVKNTTSEMMSLLDDTPEVFIEIVDRKHNPVAIRPVENLHIAISNTSRRIPAGETIYIALVFTSPALSVNQLLRVTVSHTNAADEPATIILGQSKDRS
jgi:hypothetical protein